MAIVAKEQDKVTLEKDGKFYEFVGGEWKNVNSKTHSTPVIAHAYSADEIYVFSDAEGEKTTYVPAVLLTNNEQTVDLYNAANKGHDKLTDKTVKEGTFNGYTVYYTPAE